MLIDDVFEQRLEQTQQQLTVDIKGTRDYDDHSPKSIE